MKDKQIVELIAKAHIQLVERMAEINPDFWQLYGELTSIDMPYEQVIEEIRKQIK